MSNSILSWENAFFFGASENLMLMFVEGFLSQLKSTMERRNQK